MVRALRQRPVQARELDAFRHHAELRVDHSPDAVAADAARYLRRKRFRVSRQDDGVAAEKGVLREVGSLLFHWAFFLLLVGVIVGKGTGFTGRAVVTEGETWIDARANYDGEIRTGRYFGGAHTGLGIELLDFDDSYRRNGLPIDFVSRLRFLDQDGSPLGVEEIRVNHPTSRDGTRIFQEGFGWARTVVSVALDGESMWSSPIEMTRDDPDGVPATAMPWRGAIKLTAPEPDVMITLELWSDFPSVREPPAHRPAHADARPVRPLHPVLGVRGPDQRSGAIVDRDDGTPAGRARRPPRRRQRPDRGARRRSAHPVVPRAPAVLGPPDQQGRRHPDGARRRYPRPRGTDPRAVRLPTEGLGPSGGRPRRRPREDRRLRAATEGLLRERVRCDRAGRRRTVVCRAANLGATGPGRRVGTS